MAKNVKLRGVRVNNLKNIDVTIPRDKLVVLTGLSGSGKEIKQQTTDQILDRIMELAEDSLKRSLRALGVPKPPALRI